MDGMRVAIAGGVFAQDERVQSVVAGDHQAAVVQRHLDQLAFLRPLAAEQRGQHGLGGVHAGHHVHHGHAELQRGHACIAVQRHQARFALDDQVVPRALGLGAAGVVTGDGAVNQVGLEGLELFVTQAQLLGPTGFEVVDDHVELRQQLLHDAQRLGALQVQRDGPLVAVHAVVIGGFGLANADAPVAGVVTPAGVLHLDDLGPEIGQHLAAQRPGKHARQVQHPHARQRQVGGGIGTGFGRDVRRDGGS
jgi:hypothetical protein